MYLDLFSFRVRSKCLGLAKLLLAGATCRYSARCYFRLRDGSLCCNKFDGSLPCLSDVLHFPTSTTTTPAKNNLAYFRFIRFKASCGATGLSMLQLLEQCLSENSFSRSVIGVAPQFQSLPTYMKTMLSSKWKPEVRPALISLFSLSFTCLIWKC